MSPCIQLLPVSLLRRLLRVAALCARGQRVVTARLADVALGNTANGSLHPSASASDRRKLATD